MTVQGDGVTVISWGVVVIILGIILLDTYAIWKNRGATDTISAHLRNWNAATGGLLALSSAALWIHLFIGLPKSWSDKAAIPFRQADYDKLVH
jgi:sulfite exporter TauE/SafE